MNLLTNGPEDAAGVLVLAHGAGGAMDTPFLTKIAEGVSDCGVRVVRFEFPYMAARREGGRRSGPDREPVLLDSWRSVIEHLGGGRKLVIGGKSLGGRMASLIADEVHALGLICLGYPFHPPGNPERLRTKHLASLQTPTLIVQGERDPFGGREEVAAFELSPRIRMAWLTDGDHSFRPRARSGATETSNLGTAIALVCEFIRGLDTILP